MLFCLKHSLLRFGMACMLFFLACEEITDWDLKLESENQLVVEAILTNEFLKQEITLTQSHHALNEDAVAVLDANVWVEANSVRYDFIADTSNSGVYHSKIPFAVTDNLIYTLHIDWQGNMYTASSELSNVAPLPEVTFIKQNRTDNVRFGEFVPFFNPSQQAMYEMSIDWSHLSSEAPTQAKMYFYTFSSVHIGAAIKPQRKPVFFPIGSRVIVKKFGLNDDYASFLLSIALETDWSGNFYYAAASNPPTNISPEVYGFFSTCAVISDTLIAQ